MFLNVLWMLEMNAYSLNIRTNQEDIWYCANPIRALFCLIDLSFFEETCSSVSLCLQLHTSNSLLHFIFLWFINLRKSLCLISSEWIVSFIKLSIPLGLFTAFSLWIVLNLSLILPPWCFCCLIYLFLTSYTILFWTCLL